MIGDYDNLQSDVEAIILHSQEYPFDVDCTELLNKWEAMKAPFIEAFGGKTFIRSTKPITITLSEEQRSRRFKEFLNALEENEVLDQDLENFLYINKDGFFDNKVILPYPSKHIPAGSKILKSFKHFIPDTGTVRWAQDIASTYIQESKVEGYLYLSVDPRDFLTLSENNANWTSCHALDGDYRAGNLSYMVDTTTLIAYIASDKQEHFRCLPPGMVWSSKKWRMLVHTNLRNCIYYNKQYPYDSPLLIDKVHNCMMVTFFKGSVFTEPMDLGYKTVTYPLAGQTMLTYNNINIGGRSFDTRDIIDASDYNGYCDIIHSSSYAPIAAVRESDWLTAHDIAVSGECDLDEELESVKDMLGMKIGEAVPCPCCGENHIGREDSLLCEECIATKDADMDFFLTCDGCYHRIYDEDEVYFVGDIPYCKSCYEAMKQEDEATLEEDD